MINDLIRKQKELMDKVPHTVRPDALTKMKASVDIIDVLMRFLNSCGHKPWRPNPLPVAVQQALKRKLKTSVQTLSYIHSVNYGSKEDISKLKTYSRQVVSGLGIIEETIEYLNTIGDKKERQPQLEELTDILFFYLEQVILSGFSLEDVEKEYHRKHAVNLERYKRAAEGDFGWDKRNKENL